MEDTGSPRLHAQSPIISSVAIKSEPDPAHLVPSIETPDDAEEERPLEVYRCVDCTKVYHIETQFKDHLRKSHGIIGGPYTCQHCGKIYEKQGYLNRHLRVDHLEPDTRPFCCEICGKHYARQDTLNTHVKELHPDGGERPVFPCSDCDKDYFSKYSLKQHRQRHHQQATSTAGQDREQCKPADASEAQQGPQVPIDTAGHDESHGSSQQVAPALLTQPHISGMTQGLADRRDERRGDNPANSDGSTIHRLEFDFQGARVVLEGNLDKKAPVIATPSAELPLRMSSIVDRKRKRDRDSTASFDKEQLSLEVSKEHNIVTDGLKKAYDKVIGDSFQEIIRLKQDNAMLKSENELLKKTISDLQGKKSEENLTPQIGVEQYREKERDKVLERDRSLARLNHESARARAQSEMPQTQGHSLSGRAGILGTIGRGPVRGNHANALQHSRYPHPSPPWVSVVRGSTQAPHAGSNYEDRLSETLQKPSSPWIRF